MMKCLAVWKSGHIPSHGNKSYSTPTEILPVSSVAVSCKVKAILSFAASEQTVQFLPAMIRITVLEHLL